ncbi:hypothetical protein WJX77_008971 [Trebouxia sp. C0004]
MIIRAEVLNQEAQLGLRRPLCTATVRAGTAAGQLPVGRTHGPFSLAINSTAVLHSLWDRRARLLQKGVDVTGVSAMDRTEDKGSTC